MAPATIKVQLEVGSKRAFATAVDWPGWSRSGRGAEDALQSLHEYGARYKRSIGAAGRTIVVPRALEGFDVVSRVKGDATTDFGALSKAVEPTPAVGPTELKRLVGVLQATWRAFDRAAKKAEGRTLATGRRGGGRTLAKIRDHQLDAEGSYLSKLGGSAPKGADASAVRTAFVDALGARARGELPDRGPRGGTRWSAHFAAHRSAWHALDHAWEIEDRL